uniref:discoidin domain-containing protein n=1 Tax=Clostridium haemolyticum TaxID=84025 RepID=UPI001E410327|nr:discoidin domain-containing protein [Clostridium haemolyticum]
MIILSKNKKIYCTGDRQELINISCSSDLLEYGEIKSLIDGKEENSLYFNSNKEKQWILFDFKNINVCIDSITWKQNGSYAQGEWQLQGSNDNKHFANIGKNFVLNNETFKIHNSKLFKYYKLQQINGQTTRDAWIYEIEFGIRLSIPYFLLEQNNQLYTINSEFYEASKSQYKPIAGININNITDEDLKKYGFNDIGDVLLETNISEEKFKPIDKLKTLKDGKFNILVKELEC